MIHDGYTLNGAIRGEDSILRFRYRPMLSPERREFLQAFVGWPDDAALRPVCEWLRLHLFALSVPLTLEELYEDDRPLFAVLRGAIVGVLGPNGEPWGNWELEDIENLRSGVRLEIANPGLARRTCEDCQKFWYDEDTGTKLVINGLPVLRPEEAEPACRQRDGCPVGSPEHQRRMSPRNRAAFRHFRECDAAGSFPNDPIVRRNALVIRSAIRSARKELEDERRLELGGHDGARGGAVAGHGRAPGRSAHAGADSGIWAPWGAI